jgi:hypothetical protein
VLGGYVTDAEGNPIPGVDLWIEGWYTNAGRRPESPTDDKGYFFFGDLQPSDRPHQQVRVRARKSGYQSSDEYARLGSKTHPITLRSLTSPGDGQ